MFKIDVEINILKYELSSLICRGESSEKNIYCIKKILERLGRKRAFTISPSKKIYKPILPPSFFKKNKISNALGV